MSATNDYLILEFIKDVRYNILPSGIIQTKAQRGNGHRTCRRGDWINLGNLRNDGYLFISYHRTRLAIHRIIWAAFGNAPLAADLYINHLNGIKSDNRIENLELVTPSQNMIHSFKILGRRPFFRTSPIITLQIANDIRADHKAGMSYGKILLKYKQVKSQAYISDIINEKVWKNSK